MFSLDSEVLTPCGCCKACCRRSLYSQQRCCCGATSGMASLYYQRHKTLPKPAYRKHATWHDDRGKQRTASLGWAPTTSCTVGFRQAGVVHVHVAHHRHCNIAQGVLGSILDNERRAGHCTGVNCCSSCICSNAQLEYTEMCPATVQCHESIRPVLQYRMRLAFAQMQEQQRISAVVTSYLSDRLDPAHVFPKEALCMERVEGDSVQTWQM